MASDSIHVRVSGRLQAHIEHQTGENGLYENASEYIRSLIRDDLQTQEEAWAWLGEQIAPAMEADESAFLVVTASDVIARNRSRKA